MDKSREHFEAWYALDMKNKVHWYNNGNVKNDLVKDENGSYIRTSVRQKWEGWQASRSSIEVHIPAMAIDKDPRLACGICPEQGFNLAIIWVHRALNACGLKVRGINDL